MMMMMMMTTTIMVVIKIMTAYNNSTITSSVDSLTYFVLGRVRQLGQIFEELVNWDS